MTHEHENIIRNGLNKIVKCYESNYRDYIANLGPEAAKLFKERMDVVDRMKENWEKLIIHYIGLESKSYEPANEIDELNRKIKLNEWQCMMSNMLVLVSGHWDWLCSETEVLENLQGINRIRKSLNV